VSGNKVSAGEKIMTKADSQFRFERPMPGKALAIIGAVLLILLGIVLQLGVLGYGHISLDNLWFISVIGGGIWNIFTSGMDLSAAQEFLRFWPLLIVCSGLAILLSRRPTGLVRATNNSRTEGRHEA
jgi:hypothetical protein